MSDDRIDFGPLDPQRDELRYQRLVRGVLARTRRPGLLDTVTRSGGRALALAAGLAMLAWVPVLARGQAPQATQAPSRDSGTALADLAAHGNAAAAASWFVSGGANE